MSLVLWNEEKIGEEDVRREGGATCCPHNGISFILCTPDLTITAEG